ncbi:MAG: lysophospholipase [Gemmatimonadaceae bacterium]|nr:lysophospholipase [Gemmatimonadaceae bacterium]
MSASDGLGLFLRSWPRRGAARGTVLLIHGLGEHMGRYEHVAAHLSAAGWDVVAYDQRGHGTSGGKRGAIPNANALTDDLARVVAAVRAAMSSAMPRREAADASKGGRAPLVMLGHSMGGQVAAAFVRAHPEAVDALVLSSPALDTSLNVLQRIQLAVGLALVPDVPMGNQLDATKISHDPAVVRAYLDDPLVHDRITARLAKAILDGGAAVRAAAAQWRVPTLLLWAGDDHLVSPSGSAAFAAAAPPSVVRAQRFDGLYHEIFNERDATPVFAALDAWLDRFPAPT